MRNKTIILTLYFTRAALPEKGERDTDEYPR